MHDAAPRPDTVTVTRRRRFARKLRHCGPSHERGVRHEYVRRGHPSGRGKGERRSPRARGASRGGQRDRLLDSGRGAARGRYRAGEAGDGARRGRIRVGRAGRRPHRPVRWTRRRRGRPRGRRPPPCGGDRRVPRVGRRASSAPGRFAVVAGMFGGVAHASRRADGGARRQGGARVAAGLRRGVLRGARRCLEGEARGAQGEPQRGHGAP